MVNSESWMFDVGDVDLRSSNGKSHNFSSVPSVGV